MKNIFYLPLAGLLLTGFYACQKDKIGGKSENTGLIVGKWLVYQQETKVYDLNSGLLVKDTVVSYASDNARMAWINIYNTDGSGYVTSSPYANNATVDTTSYLHYTILGSSLSIKQMGGGSETDPIVQLTQGNLTLENSRNAHPAATWGLDVNTTYNFVQDSYYNKQ